MATTFTTRINEIGFRKKRNAFFKIKL